MDATVIRSHDSYIVAYTYIHWTAGSPEHCHITTWSYYDFPMTMECKKVIVSCVLTHNYVTGDTH